MPARPSEWEAEPLRNQNRRRGRKPGAAIDLPRERDASDRTRSVAAADLQSQKKPRGSAQSPSRDSKPRLQSSSGDSKPRLHSAAAADFQSQKKPRVPTPTDSESQNELPSDCIAQLSGVSQDDWKADIQSHWLQALSKLPQAVWLRRFGTISNPVPFTSREARTSYLPSRKPSSKPSKM
jgi:hypothetical protein